MIVCSWEILVSMMFWDIVVGGRLLGMARFEVWKGRLVLHGIVRMDFG